MKSTGETIPLNRINIRLLSINGLQLLGIHTEVPLTTAAQPIYVGVLGANLASGPIVANVRIPTSGFIWKQGLYVSNVSFSVGGVLIPGSIAPSSQALNIQIPGFISVQPTLAKASLVIDDLNYYRSAGVISVNQIIPVSTTVPYVPSIRAEGSQFNFSTSLPYNSLPLSPVSAITVGLTSVSTGTPVSLSTSDQALTTPSGIALTSNNQVLTNTYSINAVQLTNSFLQAGTYFLPVTYSYNESVVGSPAGVPQAQATSGLEVLVSDLAEIVASQQVINLDFNTALDYVNGVSVDIPTHLRVSKTTPYNLTVRSTSSAFNSLDNNIPLSVLRIGPSVAQTDMNTVTLSGTAQPLIDNANPVIDRSFGVRFSIPASQAEKLLGKPSGNYSADIIFSIVAP